MTIKTTLLIAICATPLLLEAPRALAQDAATAPTPAADATATPAATATPSPGGGGNANFNQRMNDRLKAALKVSDDEWSVIQPLLEKVQNAQRAMFAGRFGGFGFRRRGGGGGPDGNNGATAGASPAARPNRPPESPEAEALRTALESDSTSNDEIKTKLQALRDARKKQQADLDQARADLQKVLTLRQEATLVQMGLLE